MSSNIKFDKETLVKHRFWIGLGVFVPLWLVAWLVLWLGVSDEVVKTKDAYAKSVKAVTDVNDPKTDKDYKQPMDAKKTTLSGRKGELHEVLWNRLIYDELWNRRTNYALDWPTNDQTPGIKELVNAPFGTPIKDKENDTRERQIYRDFLYKKWSNDKRQEFSFMAGPMTLDFDYVIGMAPIDKNPEYTLTNEEMWLNEETVWVKRELLWIIRQTIDRLAYFEPVKAADNQEPLPAGAISRHRFRNSNWELDLLLKHGANQKLVISKDSTIKNVNSSKRTLPLREIKVYLAQPSVSAPSQLVPGPTLLIQGEPLPWNKSAAIGQDWRVDAHGFSDKQDILATQVFAWSTSPIKEIDLIELGYQSSRTAFQELRGLKEEDPNAPAPSSPSPSPGSKGGVMGGPSGAAAGKSGDSPLNIKLKRYVQVTPQVRRIPVGIVLIIDQAYVEDLMTQFVNSRLRFQPTQLQWQQASGIKPPDEDGSKERGGLAGAGAKPGAGKPGAMMPGGGGPQAGVGRMMDMQNQMQGNMRGGGAGGAGQPPGGMGMIMGMQGQMMGAMQGGPAGGILPGGVPPGGGNAPNQASTAINEESDPNLLEFALYGIISLYDRYQPPPAPAGAQQPPAQPAAPADAPPKNGDLPKTDATPKAGDQPKTDATPKPEDPKDAAPKANDKKADDKKADDKPAGGEAKKAGENKGS